MFSLTLIFASCDQEPKLIKDQQLKTTYLPPGGMYPDLDGYDRGVFCIGGDCPSIPGKNCEDRIKINTNIWQCPCTGCTMIVTDGGNFNMDPSNWDTTGAQPIGDNVKALIEDFGTGKDALDDRVFELYGSQTSYDVKGIRITYSDEKGELLLTYYYETEDGAIGSIAIYARADEPGKKTIFDCTNKCESGADDCREQYNWTTKELDCTCTGCDEEERDVDLQG